MSSTSELRKFTPPGVEENKEEAENLVAPEDLKKEKPPTAGAALDAKLLTSRDKIRGFQRERVGLGTKDALADKEAQFKLIAELEKIEKDESESLGLIKKLKFGSKEKEDARAMEIQARFAPKKEALQKKLDEYKTEPTSMESLIKGLGETAKAGEKARIEQLKQKKTPTNLDRFQKIPVTPEYKAKLREWRIKELSAANKTLLEAEDRLEQATANRSNILTRLFRGKNDSREQEYATALQACAQAKAEIKRIEEEAENQGEAIIGSYATPRKTHLETPIPTSPYAIKMHTSAPPASTRAPFQPPGEPFKLKFVEPFSEQTKPEISSEAMTNAKQHLKNFVKDLFFNYPDNKNLILQDMVFQENLAANHFIGNFQTLTKTIVESQEQLAEELKLSLREQNASLDSLMAKLNARTKKMSAIDAEKYRYYLALKDLEQIAPSHQVAPKRRRALETGAPSSFNIRQPK